MIPLNLQPLEGITSDPDNLEVVNVWETLQGEGPLVGTPAVFVRLAGCTLTCNKCDSDYTTNRKFLAIEDLMDSIRGKRKEGLVVLTGGEPFRQPLRKLVCRLAMSGYRVQIETNGTLFQPDFPHTLATIVCSPKTTKIRDELKPYINSLKYILDADAIDSDGLPSSSLGMNQTPCRPWEGFPKQNVFVQPLDCGNEVENKRHVQAAVNVCLNYGFRLSTQTHKQLGLE